MVLVCRSIYCLQYLAVRILLLNDSEHIRVLPFLLPLPSLSNCVELNAPIKQCSESIVRDYGVAAVDDFLMVHRVEERDEIVERELLILS